MIDTIKIQTIADIQKVVAKKMESLQASLTTVKVLRSSVGHVFDSLGNGLSYEHGDENRETRFLSELQDLLTVVNANLRELEQSVSILSAPGVPLSLATTSYLSQETTQERQALYSSLVNSYKWTDKVHEYSNVAAALLHQNSLKRSYTNTSRSKRGRIQTSSHNVPPQQVDALIASFDRHYGNMTFTASRPFASNAVLHITMPHVLKAVVAFKGLMIERVVVKGYGETMDLWTESRYKVFQKVTENAHAAMLHFSSPTLPELSVRSFITWFQSFYNLFSGPCKKCGLHLHGARPPTWREFRTLEPYHQECKP